MPGESRDFIAIRLDKMIQKGKTGTCSIARTREGASWTRARARASRVLILRTRTRPPRRAIPTTIGMRLKPYQRETHRCRGVRSDRGDVVAVAVAIAVVIVIVIVGIAHAVVQHPYSTGNRPEKWMGSKGKGKKGKREGRSRRRDKSDKDQGQWGARIRDAKGKRNVMLELRCYMCVRARARACACVVRGIYILHSSFYDYTILMFT